MEPEAQPEQEVVATLAKIMEPTAQPAQLVVDALLMRFSPLARRRIRTVLIQDGRDGRQYLRSSEPGYDQVLDELAMVARHAPVHLLEALLKWREIESCKGASDADTNKQRLAVECIFCSACIRFVNACPPDGLNEAHWLEMEDFVFYWLINADRLVSHTEYPSLVGLRALLLDFVAQLLGELSTIRFATLTDRFFEQMDARRMDTGPQRQENLSLIHGMRHLRLGVSTPVALNASTNFLIRANPLNRTPTKKKMELRHAMCNMLASILMPLVEPGAGRWPPRGAEAALAPWYKAVFRIRMQLQAWIKEHSEHTLVGYPLISLLLCLAEPQIFVTTLPPYLDPLDQQLKEKSYRSMALDCLHLLLQFFLSVYADTKPQVTAGFLNSITPQLLGILKKRSFNLEGQHDKVVHICVTIAESNLDFAMNRIVLLLLQSDTLGEAKVIGIRALLAIIHTTTKKFNSGAKDVVQASGPYVMGNGSLDLDDKLTSTFRSMTPGGLWSAMQSSAASTSAIPTLPQRTSLDDDRSGVLPSEADCLGPYVQVVRQMLGAILKACHSQYRQDLLTSRTAMNHQTKEKQQGWQVFLWALKCVPHLIPEQWRENKMTEIVPVYSIFVEPGVREEAVQVLFRTVQDLPQSRFAVMRGMANFILRIPDEFPLLIHTSLRCLVNLLNAWRTCIAEEARHAHTQQRSDSTSHMATSGTGPVPTPLAQTPSLAAPDENRIFNLYGMEAVALIFLCLVDVQIRRTALELLHTVRALQKDLLANGVQSLQRPGPETMNVIDVFEERGEEIVQRCYWDDGRWQGSRRESDRVPTDVSLSSILEGPDNGRWARCLSELVKHVAELCSPGVQGARLEVVARLASITPNEVAGGRRGVFKKSENKFDQWRNYCMFACACPPEDDPVNGAESIRELLRLVSPVIKIGKEAQHAAWMALRHSHPAIHEALLEEGVNVGDEMEHRLNRSSGGVFPLSIHQQ